MDDFPPPRSPFERLHNELYDSIARFDAMMQQSPFGAGFWWPPTWFQQRPLDPMMAQAQPQQRPGPFPALQQGGTRNEMVPCGGSTALQFPQGGRPSWFQHNSCVPRMDLRDAGDKLVLHADMPGLEKNDVKVEAHDGRLSIQAQRSNRNEQTDGNWFVQERCNSSFYRSFALPPGVQSEGIKATYDNGVLEVNIPKAAGPSIPPPKTINVE